MQPGANGVYGHITCGGNFVVAEARDLAHQEHVAIEIRQCVDCPPQRNPQLLSRRRDQLGELSNGRAPAAVSNVIERQISRNAKDPRPPADWRGVRDARSTDAQKHLLRQIGRGISAADDPPEVLENAVPLVGVETVRVGQKTLAIETPDTAKG